MQMKGRGLRRSEMMSCRTSRSLAHDHVCGEGAGDAKRNNGTAADRSRILLRNSQHDTTLLAYIHVGLILSHSILANIVEFDQSLQHSYPVSRTQLAPSASHISHGAQAACTPQRWRKPLRPTAIIAMRDRTGFSFRILASVWL